MGQNHLVKTEVRSEVSLVWGGGGLCRGAFLHKMQTYPFPSSDTELLEKPVTVERKEEESGWLDHWEWALRKEQQFRKEIVTSIFRGMKIEKKSLKND